MSDTPDSTEKKSIEFENGRSAEVLPVRQASTAPEILQTLDIPQVQAAIIVTGSTEEFEPRLHNRLLDLLSRGVAQAAQERDTLILDSGTREGVSGIVGQGVADRGHKSKLVGVLGHIGKGENGEAKAANTKALDANHTHFVNIEWDRRVRQAELLCNLAETAAKNRDWIISILVGGELDGNSLDVAVETVRRKWPLLVIEGSGPLADEIVKRKKEILDIEKRTGLTWNWISMRPGKNPLDGLQENNPRLFEILSDGEILIIEKGFDAIQLRNLIKGIFTHPPKEGILWSAWMRFAEYDQNSVRHRKLWRWLKNVPLVLGALSTLIVLLYSAAEIDNTTIIGEGIQNPIWSGAYVSFMNTLSGIRGNDILDLIFRFIIILLPIASTIVLGVETRLKLGSKYIVLRGAAEAVKRGIYSYRVLNGREGNTPDMLLPYNEQGLATHLAKVSKLLQDSDVSESAITPYEGNIPPNMFGAEAYDDGFSPLDPETYLRIRVGDQLKFYTLRTNQYENRIRRLQYLMLILGGIGTFLAAIGAQYWIPLTAGLVSAATAYLEYQQMEQILSKYNMTRSSLEIARANWLAIPEEERAKNVQKLVREVEAILESENQGWVEYVKQVQEGGPAGDVNAAEAGD